MKSAGKENPPKVQREHRSNYDDVELAMKRDALTLAIPCIEEEVREIEEEVREDSDPLEGMLNFLSLREQRTFQGELLDRVVSRLTQCRCEV
jgi:hypothetical protein